MGKKANFSKNEWVNLTCSTLMSRPPAQLIVLLDGKSIDADTNYYESVNYSQYENGLTTTSMKVQFPSYWLHSPKSELLCSSSIVHRFNRTATIKFDARSDAFNRTTYYIDKQIYDQESNAIRPQLNRKRRYFQVLKWTY